MSQNMLENPRVTPKKNSNRSLDCNGLTRCGPSVCEPADAGGAGPQCDQTANSETEGNGGWQMARNPQNPNETPGVSPGLPTTFRKDLT